MTVDVSIIVPCYNTSQYIEQCLRSALEQKDVNCEVILIDDCSTDNSLEIVKHLATEFDNLLILENDENIGQAISRNRGLDVATGRYVAMLDSDDWYVDELVLSRWVAHAKTTKSDMCIGHYLRLKENGEIETIEQSDVLKGVTGTVETHPEFTNIGMQWQILFERSFLERHSIRYSDRLRQREDRVFFTWAMMLAERMSIIDMPILVYREHENSTMKRVTWDQFEMFSTHMEIVSENYDQVRAAGRNIREFSDANAVRYWIAMLRNWAPLIQSELSTVDKYTTIGDLSPKLQTYFTNLQKLTHKDNILYQNPHFSSRHRVADWVFEGDLDIARICIKASRFDLLRRVLNRERLNLAQVHELYELESFDWAQECLTHYLRFHRNAIDSSLKPSRPAGELLAGVERLVLHLGQPKTGTSAIQDMLEIHRRDLSKKGVLYPVTGVGRERGERRMRSAGHSAYLKALLGITADAEIFNAFQDQLAYEIEAQPVKVHTVVMSAESVLSHLYFEDSDFADLEEIVHKITRELGFPKIEIVALFREPQSWLRSMYREVISSIHNDKFLSPAEFQEQLSGNGMLQFDKIRRTLQTAPNVVRTHFDSYEVVKQEGSGKWFSSILGDKYFEGLELTFRPVNVALSDAQAFAVMQSKALWTSRNQREELLRNISQNEALRSSNFRLFQSKQDEELSGQEWFDHQRTKDGSPQIGNVLPFDLFQASCAHSAQFRYDNVRWTMEQLKHEPGRFAETKNRLNEMSFAHGRYTKLKESWIGTLSKPLLKLVRLVRRALN
ncbi:glycosyltransferase family 2 protein [Aliiroseovarius marinus]|uniref:glycosyltransferase family 2 protein n=1 Tax=Aliiroseovarius marinus TaxID=2500159 RepID=UPI00106144E3|nr:glycosyltransferase [Aliiroseovarius marinus]